MAPVSQNTVCQLSRVFSFPRMPVITCINYTAQQAPSSYVDTKYLLYTWAGICKVQRCQQTFEKITTLFIRVFWNKDKTRGAMEPMPPPETVFEMPKSVPEKFGARSTWLNNIWWHTNTWPNNICWEQMLLEGFAPCHVASWQGTIEPHSQHLCTRRSLLCVPYCHFLFVIPKVVHHDMIFWHNQQSACWCYCLKWWILGLGTNQRIGIMIGYKPNGWD